MKYLLALILLILTVPVLAQDEDKNAIFVGGVYARRDVELRLPSRSFFDYNADQDSIGWEFQYMRFPVKILGIGIEAGATFHNKSVAGVTSCGPGCTITSTGTSKVALGYANYAMQLQDRNGAFQPYVKGTLGVQRSDFGGITYVAGVGNVNVHGGSQFTYGGGAGIDWKVGKKTFLRTGMSATQAFGGDTRQVDLKAVAGLVFKF